MRFRLPLGRGLFLLSAFLFSLVALLPLRLALDGLSLGERGFSAREAKGSVWLGTLGEARLGPVDLGDLQARLRTLPLVVGRARLDLRRGGEGDRFTASITVSRHDFGIDDATAVIPVGAAFAPLPVASLALNDVTAHFADGRCARAEGSVTAILSDGPSGLPLPAKLLGTVRCDKGALLVPLASPGGGEALDVRLFDDGRYQVELAVRPADDGIRNRLIASGFQLSNRGYALRASGRF